MEYTLVEGGQYGNGVNGMIEKVNDLIKKGWEPCGSIAISRDSNGYHYFVQPMIKRVSE